VEEGREREGRRRRIVAHISVMRVEGKKEGRRLLL